MEISDEDNENVPEQDQGTSERSVPKDETQQYIVFKPPRYSQPPYLDPKYTNLDLRERIKIMCSYHTFLSKNVAKVANIQINSCSYPNPIGTSVSSFRTRSNGSENNIVDTSVDYVSRSGRVSKRKNYAETDADQGSKVRKMAIRSSPSTSRAENDEKNQTKISMATEMLKRSLQETLVIVNQNEEESITGKKGVPLTPTRNRSTKQRQQNTDSPEESFRKYNKNSPVITRQQRRGDSEGSSEPSTPTAKKPVKKSGVPCPLCAVEFAQKDIEVHASTCGLGEVTKLAGFRCHLCDKFFATHKVYSTHVQGCNGRRPES